MQRLNVIDKIILRANELQIISIITGNEIQKFYFENYGKDVKVIVFVVLEGATRFASFMFSHKHLGHYKNFETYNIRAKSYEGTLSPGEIEIDWASDEFLSNLFLENKHVLVVDDIHDTGKTLCAIKRKLLEYKPKTIEFCTMLQRKIRRDNKLNVRFVGKIVEEQGFLVGGGLDYKGKLRDLPYIGTLKMKSSEWEKESGEIYKEYTCNKCGETCRVKEGVRHGKEDDRGSPYGLINGIVRGGYFSPVLSDVTAYCFDMCEKCVQQLFDSFKIPVDMVEYDIWTGEVYK